VQDFLLSIGDAVAARYTAVAFDRPGAGFSGRPERDGGSPQAQAAILRAAAAALGLRRPILVGHSFGAAVALAWALEAPAEVGAVVTIGGHVLPVGGPPPWVHSIARSRLMLRGVGRLGRSRLGRPLVRRALRRVFSPDLPPPEYEALALLALDDDRMVHDGEDLKASDAGLRALAARYPELHTPVVIVVGDLDRVVPLRSSYRLAELLPRAELVVLPAAGHLPQFSRPDVVLAAIDRAVALADA
jgi:pimeloyl-ACP methyl ester carboxylesterase